MCPVRLQGKAPGGRCAPSQSPTLEEIRPRSPGVECQLLCQDWDFVPIHFDPRQVCILTCPLRMASRFCSPGTLPSPPPPPNAKLEAQLLQKLQISQSPSPPPLQLTPLSTPRSNNPSASPVVPPHFPTQATCLDKPLLSNLQGLLPSLTGP